MCAFLDPRFKDLDPFIPEDERCDVVESVKLEMFTFLNDEPVVGNDSNEEVEEPTPKIWKLAGSPFLDFAKSKTKEEAVQKI